MATRPVQSTIDIHMRATCRMLAGHFTARDLVEEIGIKDTTAYRMIREGLQQGWISCQGVGVRGPSGLGSHPFLYRMTNPFEGKL